MKTNYKLILTLIAPLILATLQATDASAGAGSRAAPPAPRSKEISPPAFFATTCANSKKHPKGCPEKFVRMETHHLDRVLAYSTDKSNPGFICQHTACSFCFFSSAEEYICPECGESWGPPETLFLSHGRGNINAINIDCCTWCGEYFSVCKYRTRKYGPDCWPHICDSCAEKAPKNCVICKAPAEETATVFAFC